MGSEMCIRDSAKLGERRASKVALPGLANNPIYRLVQVEAGSPRRFGADSDFLDTCSMSPSVNPLANGSCVRVFFFRQMFGRLIYVGYLGLKTA